MITDMLQRIRSYLAQPGVTKAGLATKAGLHPNTLRDADQPTWNPNAATLKAIEPHLPPLDGPGDEAASATKDGEIVRAGAEVPAGPFSATSSATSAPEEGMQRPPRSSTGPTPTPLDGAEWLLGAGAAE